MVNKREFKKDVSETFISEAEKPIKAEDIVIPKGYKLVKENKSARMQLLVRPETKNGIKELAEAAGVSMNDLANDIFDEYLERQGKK